jgi:hypothetical protein
VSEETAESATVIVVTEAGGRQVRYALPHFGELRNGELVIGRHLDDDKQDDKQIQVDVIYPPGEWKRAAKDGAEVPEDLSTARALGIAKRALEAVTRISDPNVAIKLAADALEEIYAETDL